MFLGYKAKSWELLQTLCGPNLFPHYYNLGYLFANFITILMTGNEKKNPLMTQKNNEDFWKHAVSALRKALKLAYLV